MPHEHRSALARTAANRGKPFHQNGWGEKPSGERLLARDLKDRPDHVLKIARQISDGLIRFVAEQNNRALDDYAHPN